jgi:hypothetical protein
MLEFQWQAEYPSLSAAKKAPFRWGFFIDNQGCSKMRFLKKGLRLGVFSTVLALF